ncbi:IS3 family transposase [Asaccharospora irregularis]
MNKPNKDTYLIELVKECQDKSKRTYGYRRVHICLKRQYGIILNPKTILRIMNKYNLLSQIRRRKKYKQMGQHLHKYKNLLNREFTASEPNHKWVTDISYIHTKQGVLYLSIIKDLY